jgi:hypothetical protein
MGTGNYWPEMTEGAFVSSYRHFASADMILESESDTLLLLKVFETKHVS